MTEYIKKSAYLRAMFLGRGFEPLPNTTQKKSMEVIGTLNGRKEKNIEAP